MHGTLYRKTLYNLRWQLLGWFVTITALACLTMSVFNAFSDASVANSLVGNVPESMRSLIGSISNFTTVPGYIAQQVFGPNLVIVTIIMAPIIALSVSASEEEDDRLQTLLSLPVSRSGVYFAKLFAIVDVIAIICLGIALGTALGLIIVGHTADWSRIMLSVFDCWLMNTAYALVAYALAMAIGKRGLTIALTAGYTAASFVISSLAPSVDKLKTVDKFSIYHYYNNPQIMEHGINLEHVYVLVAVCLVLIIIGWISFTKRSIQT